MEIAEAVLLIWSIIIASPEPVVLTYYGTESDGFLGQHHGAYWNGYDCGLSDVVDLEGYGVAAPRWIPYCTELLVCYEDVCVTAVVVDRMADDIKDGMPRMDVWPVVAEELDIIEAGRVIGYYNYYNTYHNIRTFYGP